MPDTHVINVDLAKVLEERGEERPRYVTTLGWGQPVEILKTTDETVVVAAREAYAFDMTSGDAVPVPLRRV